MALLGPLDILRRSRSSVSTRCKLLRGLTGMGRLVAAPGREGALEKLADLESFSLGGETTTGPPSFLLMVAHLSGSREEKLRCSLDVGHKVQKRTYNGAIISMQKSLRILSACLTAPVVPAGVSEGCSVSLIEGFPASRAMDCQIHNLSICTSMSMVR